MGVAFSPPSALIFPPNLDIPPLTLFLSHTLFVPCFINVGKTSILPGHLLPMPFSLSTLQNVRDVRPQSVETMPERLCHSFRLPSSPPRHSRLLSPQRTWLSVDDA